MASQFMKGLSGGISGAGIGAQVGGGYGAAAGAGVGILASLLGGDDGDPAAEMQKAYNEAMAYLNDPSLAQELVLQKYQQAGLLTPELEQTFLQQNSKVSEIQEDPALKEAQMTSLQALQERGRGGMTAEERAALNQSRQEISRDANAQQQAILQNMQMRGIGGAGAELAASLANQQASAERRSEEGDRLAAMANENALAALTQGGNLAGSVRSQDFNVANTKASAADEMNRFNVQNQQGVATRNINRGNEASASNLANEQDVSNKNVSATNAEKQRAANARLNLAELKAKARIGQGSSAAGYMEQSNANNAQATQDLMGGLGQLASNPGIANAFKSSGGGGVGTLTAAQEAELRKNKYTRGL